MELTEIDAVRERVMLVSEVSGGGLTCSPVWPVVEDPVCMSVAAVFTEDLVENLEVGNLAVDNDCTLEKPLLDVPDELLEAVDRV